MGHSIQKQQTTYSSQVLITFVKIGHVLGYKSNLGNLKKKMKSYQASFLTTTLYDCTSIPRRKTAKDTNTWRLKQHATKKTNGSLKKSKRKFKKCLEANDNKDKKNPKLWDAEKSVLFLLFIYLLFRASPWHMEVPGLGVNLEP